MENDNKKYLDENIEGEEKKIFRFDYDNQNIEKNREFQNWKLEVEKKNSKEVLLFKCNKDRIYYFREKYDFEEYECECPQCKQCICCFCSRIVDGPDIFSRFIRKFCCLKRSIYFIFFREKFDDDEYPYIAFILGFFLFIIPFFNNFGIILCIIQNLFCLKKPKNYNYDNYYSYHSVYYQKKLYTLYNCLKLINIGFSLCLGICFINLTFIYTIILLFLSIPFKLRPINNLIFLFLKMQVSAMGEIAYVFYVLIKMIIIFNKFISNDSI